MARSVFRIAVRLLAPAAPVMAASAQLIPIRTVPIAEAGQYEFFPAANYGMGSISIAMRDSLLDPYLNPALGARGGRATYFGAPTFFAVTNGAGSGQAYPFGGIVRVGRSFFGGSVAFQSIDPARRSSDSFFGPGFSSFLPLVPEPPQSETRNNYHVQGLVGHSFSPGLTIAASGFWSDLAAIEGMDLLFKGSHSLRLAGRRSDVRLGVLREWRRHSLEAVVLRSTGRDHYLVQYAERFWDPNQRMQNVRTWSERTDGDQRTTGLHVKYDRPLRDSTWRAGAIVTVNRTAEHDADHYQFMDMPTDPSRTVAYNVGIGISRDLSPMRYGLDLILEPAWRRARTAPVFDQPDVADAILPDLESYFRFTNFVLRGGISRDIIMSANDNRLRLQAGVQLRNVNYRLEQHDWARSRYQERGNSWREWTHSWGATFAFTHFQLAYQLRMLSGMGRLDVPPADNDRQVAVDPFFPFPVSNPSATLYPVRVTSHQLSFAWPVP